MTNPIVTLGSAQVTNPTSAQIGDGNGVMLAADRHGDVLISETHGRFYSGAARGNVFCAAAAGATGLILTAAAQTTAGLCVWNPVGSNVVMEVLEILLSPLTAASNVVTGAGIEYGAPPSVVGTAVTPASLLVGGTVLSPQGKASTGGTIIAMTFLQWLPVMQMSTTTLVGGGSTSLYKPEGTVLISPGGAINLIGKAAQSAVWMQHVTWAEWPI